jgi:hypothetical protein
MVVSYILYEKSVNFNLIVIKCFIDENTLGSNKFITMGLL